MLSKVLKKMKADGKLNTSIGSTSTSSKKSNVYPTSHRQSQSGFHAKANSQKGAERQRDMGNRMQKPSPSK